MTFLQLLRNAAEALPADSAVERAMRKEKKKTIIKQALEVINSYYLDAWYKLCLHKAQPIIDFALVRSLLRLCYASSYSRCRNFEQISVLTTTKPRQ